MRYPPHFLRAFQQKVVDFFYTGIGLMWVNKSLFSVSDNIDLYFLMTGKPGNWAFTAPERPSDLGKLVSSSASSVNNSRQDLTSRSSGHELTSSTRSDTSVKPENNSLASPTKTSNSIPFKSLNTHEEEGGFVVIEAANEAMASVWASKDLDGQQPRPPAREKHLHSHSSNQQSSISGMTFCNSFYTLTPSFLFFFLSLLYSVYT